jgi:prepilin-type N-terminal cleavage/methylation domain-containing protein
MKCKTLKNNSGFTLVELIVTIAIAGILMTAIGSVFVFGSNMVNTTQSKFDEHSAALQLQNNIKTKVQYADSLKIYKSASDTVTAFANNTHNLYFSNGLISDGASLQSTMASYSYIVIFSGIGTTVLQVNVTINKTGSDSYTLNQSVPLPNLAIKGNTIAAGTSQDGTAATNATTNCKIGFETYKNP